MTKLWIIAVLWAAAAHAEDKATPAFRLPTATEIFQLRSRCAELGDKLMDANHVGVALSQTNVSHYDPRSNRCYVTLEISTADTTAPIERFEDDRYLYDGQTREMLAHAHYKGGPLSRDEGGVIFMKDWPKFAAKLGLSPPSHVDFNFVRDLIDAVMADDRTQ